MITYRRDIDGIRALAVIAVMVFHAFPSVLPGGFCGVDVFFVISGYLIGSISLTDTRNNRFSAYLFYKKRIRRLVPPLLCVLIAVFSGSFLLMECGEVAMTARHVAAGALFIDNFVLLREAGYFDTLSETKPLLHLWSLGVEEQFYILCPLLFVLFQRSTRKGYCAVILLLILSFILNIWLSASQDQTAFYLPFSRLWEMGAGILLAGLVLGRSPAQLPDLSWPGLLLLSIAFFCFSPAMRFPGYAALQPVIGCMMIIGSGESGLLNRSLLQLSLLQGIGRISYSLYLWHWPLLVFATILMNGQPGILVRIAALLLAFILAGLSWHYVEQTTRFGGPARIKTRFFVIAPLLVATTAYTVTLAHGFCSWRSRVPSLITSLRAMENPYLYYNYAANLRVGICHFVTEQQWWNNHCLDLRKHNIFLIGDSYAAALYPGLQEQRDLYYPEFGLTQLTDGNAPPFTKSPLMRIDRGISLGEVNANHLAMIRQYQPDIVLIGWFAFGSNASRDAVDSAVRISRTVEDIHSSSPRTRILLMGTFPKWQMSLKDQILRFYDTHHELPPEWMHDGLDQDNAAFETNFRAAFHSPYAQYLSSQEVLCPKAACLTRLSDRPQDITAVDWGHLSAPASRYLISRLSTRIFSIP
ncbi:acyltransferase [Acetobacter sicerae]|uniref:Acyltransferase n=1 Tax=Acetobacter sicerae TaxID=85325 RepID=A0ABS8VWF0_9PROT|nr:acyltransferase family protein [Acetobacter sicerae]MCE0745035.1 acyltransferase [Acetobacter sicerae]